MCLKHCPSFKNDSSKPTELECKPNANVTDCKENKDGDINGQFWIYDTRTFIGRVCIPEDSIYYNAVKNIINPNTINMLLSDLNKSWWLILGFSVYAFVLAFIWMYFVKFCSGVIVWACIIIYLAAVGVLAYVFYGKSVEYDAIENDDTKNGQAKYLRYAFYGLIAIFSLSILFFICIFSKIRIVVAILESATDFVTDVPSSLWVPPVIGVIEIGLACYWLILTLYLYSSGE